MKTTLHDCAVPSCSRPIAIQYHVCNRCWRFLSYELRKDVRDASIGSRTGTIGAAELRAVVAKAVAEIEAKQEATGGEQPLQGRALPRLLRTEGGAA